MDVAVVGPVDIVEVPGTTFLCPFCDKPVWSGDLEGLPCLLHQVPVCETFDDLAPEEFVSACLRLEVAKASPAAKRQQPS